MKYPITLLVLATVMLVVGVGMRMHAEVRYTNKMFYHTIESGLYGFDEVFAERKFADTVQLLSIIGIGLGGSWIALSKVRRDRRK